MIKKEIFLETTKYLCLLATIEDYFRLLRIGKKI